MGSLPRSESLTVLTVEDNPAEVRLLSEAFEAQTRCVTHLVATDGTEAFDALHGRGAYADSPTPDLVLLDIDLPGRQGTELLPEIRATDAFETLPVIMYSNTRQAETVRTCYRRGANAYVVKPGDYVEIVTAIENLLSFWVDTAELDSR